MAKKESSELIQSLLNQARELPHRDNQKLDALVKRTEMIIGKVFGENSSYKTHLNKIWFSPGVYYTGMPDSNYDKSFKSGMGELINLINTMLEDVQLSNEFINEAQQEEFSSKEVFIVHGHNEEMKQTVARVIEKLGLTAIILHEQPNKGRTLIEKFVDYSRVSFAIVLLSPDDVAFKKNESIEQSKLRARQNVILELGFFLGKLGRERVLVLYDTNEQLEIPSDYQGVIYVAYDSDGRWRFDLARELRACGFNIDVNLLI